MFYSIVSDNKYQNKLVNKKNNETLVTKIKK